MPSKNDPAVIIRKYGIFDMSAVRRICCETALMGEPSDVFFDDNEIFADALTKYFTDYEPESCFVAEYDKRIVGYLLGATDVRRMNAVFARKIAIPLFIKALGRGVFFRGMNAKFILRALLSLVKGEFNAPSFSGDYPATLHINVDKECRGSGIGSKLIDAYLEYLRRKGVKGVHFATMSESASRFFKERGFQLLFEAHRSYFGHFLGKNVPVYIYGMRLR